MSKIKWTELTNFAKDVPATKESDVYSIHDWVDSGLKNLTVSWTVLKSGQQTRGHSHKGVEEVYIFVKGFARLRLGDEELKVGQLDVVPIPDGVFHQVISDLGRDCVFFCVFQSYEDEVIGRVKKK